jgi:hypothetical protein
MLMAEMAMIAMMFVDEILESGDTDDRVKSLITDKDVIGSLAMI